MSREDWKGEWDGTSVWTAYRSDQAGVAFLFNRNLDIKIFESKCDGKGRSLRISAEIDGQKVQLVNIYGPNPVNAEKSQTFFKEIDKILIQNIAPIICGDFNMVEDREKDRRGGTFLARHTYGKSALNDLIEGFDLVDIWRQKNPDRRQFTWHSPDESIHSRLDRIYLPKNFVCSVFNSYIRHFVWSDHDVCGVKFTLPNSTIKGKGYWKLNTNFLSHENFQNKIQTFWDTWINKKQDFEDIGLWWDCFKIYVKSISIEHAKEIHEIRKNTKYSLLADLERERGNHLVDTENIRKIEENLLQIEKETNEKIFIHTHTSLRETNEEPTKYFYSLLRVRQKQTNMDSLLKSDGTLITQQDELIDETKRFYEKLYTKKEDVSLEDQSFFLNKIDTFLSPQQKRILQSEIKLEELEIAMKQGNKDKMPGYDGLPYEFYETFWEMIGKEFLNVVNFCLNISKKLPHSQTTSIIALSYKKKDRRLLKNWRPISLLCCDYKIISKLLGNRLKCVLDTVLSERQTCSVPGRSIFQNLNYIRDIIFYCDVNKINGYILSVDQEKAFDMLDRDFVIKIMRKMNFGERFIQWLEVIFNENISRILLNGYISTSFDVTRGVRQGCSLSAYVYAVYLHVVDIALSSDRFLIGIPIPGKTGPQTVLYADDLNLVLLDKSKISNALSIFERFERATGSRINPEKTQGFALGNPDLSDPYFREVEWKNLDGIEVLGLTFLRKYSDTVKITWKKILEKMYTQLCQLRFRKLSLKGKVTILNSLVLSKAWYAASAIQMTDDIHKSIERLMMSFLWKNKPSFDKQQRDPIKRKTLYQLRDNGGLALKNPKRQQNALQLKYFLDEENKDSWIQLPRYWLGFDLQVKNPEWHFLRQYPRLGPTAPKNKFYKHYSDNLITFNTFSMDTFPDKEQWTTSMFYSELTKLDEHPPKAYIDFWSYHRVQHPNMWGNIHKSLALGIHQDIHYRFLHRILPTNAFQKNRFHGIAFRNINSKCASCPTQDETNEHLFFRCVAANAVMNFIRTIFSILIRSPNFKLFKIALNIFPEGTSYDIQKMASGLLQIAMYVVWNNRNKFKFHREIVHLNESKNTIMKHFHSVILQKYKKHMPHDPVKFTRKFCHTPEICNLIRNEVLHVDLFF